MRNQFNRPALAVAAAFFLCLASQGLAAQETPADPAAVPPAETAAAEANAPAATPEATPENAAAEPAVASAEEQDTVATIPVEDSTAPTDGAPRYPYTFAAARLMHAEYDASGMDGLGVEGSYLLLPNIYAVAAYLAGRSDENGSNESSQFELGAGFRQELTPALDLNIGLRMLKVQRADTAATSDQLGYRFDAGVRGDLLPRLEGSAGVYYIDANQNSHAFLAGSALYELLPRLSAGAEAILGNGSTSYAILGRWEF